MAATMSRLPIGLLLAAAALAAPDNAAADPHRAVPVASANLPAGRVGRIAEVSGKVEMRPGATTGWSEADRNDPVGAGSAVRSGAQSLASIEIGTDWLYLSADSEVAVAALEDDAWRLAPMRGRFRLVLDPRRAGDRVDIGLAQGSLRLERPGRYELDAGSEGPPRLAVLAGGARLLAAGATIGIGPGEAVVLVDTAPTALTIAPGGIGEIADWPIAAPVDAAPATATDFVSPDMTGVAELSRAGKWRHISGYGEVWLPDAVPAGWTPYRNGHWRWFPPWGWTWIDDAAWGFAPSHYGRWALIGERWAWLPGQLVPHPIYLPAAVAFIGTPGIGVSYAGGHGPAIGWFPLAPGEAYWPSYSDDLDYIRAANRADVADLATIGRQPEGRLPVEIVGRPFANRLAATVVPRADFIGGRRVAPALLELPKERLREVPVMIGSPRIAAPAPPPVAATGEASPSRPRPIALAAGRAAWIKTVRIAAIRSRLYLQTARWRRLVLHFGAAVAERDRLHGLAPLRLVHRTAAHNKETTR
jgi:hypothetical protein